jgi:hypothetical protein
MTELTKAHCEICVPGTPPLSEDEAATLAAQLPGWERAANRTVLPLIATILVIGTAPLALRAA